MREIDGALQALAAGVLRVAVLGQFKRGKSTLLNALIGAEVLPTGILPLTSVATEVRDGPGELWVYATGHPPRLAPISTLAEYVTEVGNPENAKGIERVEVRVPLPPWARHVVFRDTPGVGSIHESANREAIRLLSEVDAAVFVVSPDPPISGIELDFLRRVAEHAAKFYFVLNKIDAVPAVHVDELAAYLERALRERAGFSAPAIYRCSARRALESVVRRSGSGPPGDPGLSALVRDLDRYLGSDRARSVRDSVDRRAHRYALRLRGIERLARAAFHEQRALFDTAMQRLDRATADLEEERRAADALLEDDLMSLLRELEVPLTRFRESTGPVLVTEIAGRLSSSRAVGGASFVREFDMVRREFVLPRVAALRGELERSLSTGLDAAGRRYAARLRALVVEIDRTVGEIFQVAIAPLGASTDLAPSADYYARTDGLMDNSFAGQTALFLPAALLRGRIRRRLPALIAEELDGQTGRLRSDLLERGRRTVAAFRDQLREQVERNGASLRAAARAGQHAAAADPQVRQEWIGRLDDWERELDALLSSGAALPNGPGSATVG
ncbi:MAG TPA: dynamin family protein [Thermoplasmata archaeon]|nr:dynamin family protein [Thermoplasmata archaeon]